MNLRTIVLSVTFATMYLAVSAARADRVPIDTKTRTIEADHIVFGVTDSQVLEMDTQDTLTLTEEQWSKVRQSGLPWPMRIDSIVDYDTDGCGCFTIEPHAIRLAKNKVAMITGVTGVTDPDAQQLLATTAQPGEIYGTVTLKTDRHGQFYAKGVLIPFRQLLKHFQTPLPPSETSAKATLRVSLPIDIERDSPLIKFRLDQLFAAASASGWKVSGSDKPLE